MSSDRIDPSIRLLVREATVPLRTSASESAEMSSQLLFGETCTCLATEGNWYHVRRDWDGYEGWLDAKMTAPPHEGEGTHLSDMRFVLSGSLRLSDGSLMALPLGARVPSLAGRGFRWAGETYEPTDTLRLWETPMSSHLVEAVQLFRNVPYLWGGVSGWGLDCSGLMQTAAAMCGIALPRDSSQQALVGQEVPWGEQQAGDLAFFAKPQQSKITHVGMLRDPATLVHASGRVRLDRFSAQGIVHSESGILTHHLITIRRC